MKKYLFCSLFMLFANFVRGEQFINAVIGDISFQNIFGMLPDENTCGQLRITTHLNYVEQLLLHNFSAGLSREQQCNRNNILRLLQKYIIAGNFPSNYDFPGERKPCFIDKTGNICAVGYLVEKTEGRYMAELINLKNKYSKISEMDESTTALIQKWCYKNGLTLKECAMIQPTYGPPPPDDINNNTHITTGYAISSAVLGGINLPVIISNISRFNSGFKNKLTEIGLVLGTAQLISGIVSIKHPDYYAGLNSRIKVVYKAQNNLSYINIAVGSATIISSAYNLFLNKKIKDKKTTYGLFSYPNSSNNLTMGLTMVKKF